MPGERRDTVPERVIENLNRGLHEILARDERVCLLGEDVLDPYGGAFKATRGLSSRFPDRVLSTPISENALIGIANGLALCGQRPIVEIMFGDFLPLCFDQIYNFATKSVSMYGRQLPMHLIVRSPVGGNRGYGPTHSQSPQKHFIGVPHLTLVELSPFHDSIAMLSRLVELGEPAILFEDKTLYARRMYTDGRVSDLMSFDYLDSQNNFARAFVADPDECDCLIITGGATADRALEAAHRLFLEHELVCQVVTASQLYPFALDPLLPLVRRARRVCVLEEGTTGGSWGSEVAALIYERLWDRLRAPVLRISSADRVIPAAMHLEREVIVNVDDICASVREACCV
jgi:pyruvate dehydrogenase E1 component beta subunit